MISPYQYPCTCSICGERGMAHVRDTARDWMEGGTFTHSDPRVCTANLAARKRREEAQTARAQIVMAGEGI